MIPRRNTVFPRRARITQAATGLPQLVRQIRGRLAPGAPSLTMTSPQRGDTHRLSRPPLARKSPRQATFTRFFQRFGQTSKSSYGLVQMGR